MSGCTSKGAIQFRIFVRWHTVWRVSIEPLPFSDQDDYILEDIAWTFPGYVQTIDFQMRQVHKTFVAGGLPLEYLLHAFG